MTAAVVAVGRSVAAGGAERPDDVRAQADALWRASPGPCSVRSSAIIEVVESSGVEGGVSMPELLAALSLGTDLGMGHPMEHVLRQTYLALRLAGGDWAQCR